MYEVEVKVEAAHGPVRERLADLDAEALDAVHQHDTYYDHPTRSFAETDEALRLRREETTSGGATSGGTTSGGATAGANDVADASSTTATLTYKGPLVDDVSKTREEVETDVADPGAVDAILGAIGFDAAAEVEKERERFAVDGYVVALDTVRDLGEFVEVEATGEGTDVETLREGAFDLCRRLGLDTEESTRSSYLALLIEAGG